MKYILIALGAALLIGAGVYFYQTNFATDTDTLPPAVLPDDTTSEPDNDDGAQVEDDTDTPRGPQSVLGQSAGGNDITAYHFGTGANEIVFIGGTHGGYSFNTSLVAYELIDYLVQTPTAVPNNITVTVIPALNPDGIEVAAGTTGRFSPNDITASETTRVASRFNANNVDINRNFNCEWSAEALWQDRPVSGGSAAFSEPEARAIRSYVALHQPTAAVVWYSAAGGVFASGCGGSPSTESTLLTNLYAEAANYPAFESFDFYAITGDMVNWFARENIPAISVLLTDRQNTEWSKNQLGITAILNHYSR